jgi:hypothetical protein
MLITSNLENSLIKFKDQFQIVGVGALGTILVLTRKAKKEGLPFDLDKLLTAGGGQVSGLSGSNINNILKSHNIIQTVGTESGRTSRGTPTLAKEYASFVHALLPLSNHDLEAMEAW